jgi:hypothetical protein
LKDTFPQRLKPHGFCGSYGTAEAVPFPILLEIEFFAACEAVPFQSKFKLNPLRNALLA